MRQLLITSILIFLFNTPIAFSKNNSSPGIQLNKNGLIELHKKNYTAAARLFIKAINKNKTNKFYYNNLAVAAMKLKKYKLAFKSLSHALQIDPVYVKALSNMSIVCFHLGEYRMAYSYYKKAKAEDKNYITSRFTRKKAIKRLQVLQQKNPKNKVYNKLLKYLKDKDIPN